ncbi:MAG: hypothetical protein N2Z72_00530 [Bacteroidales bacterium]|nr:hypothetical protein [Bacteroidales bacterium]
MDKIAFIFLLLSFSNVFAQSVGVGSSFFTPDASAMLEVQATNKGILIPRVTLTGINDAVTIPSPATSLLVYNTGGALPTGYYYNSGTSAAPVWTKLITTQDAWLIRGNAATDPVNNFIGTTDNQPLVFRTNNVERMRILSTGNVGIGTSNPTQRLDVTGNIQFSGALMPNGTAGASGQYLRSQGAGLPPVWFSPAATLVYQNAFNSTANVCVNNNAWMTHPGVSVTLALQAGDVVFAWGYGGAMADNNCDGTTDVVYCYIDVRIAVNGADFPDGAWARVGVDYSGSNYSPFTSYSIAGRYTVPANGNYTFELQTRRANTAGGNAITAGDNTSALQSGMMLMVYRP